MSTAVPFHPFPLLKNRYAQTIVASQFYWPLEPPSCRQVVPLPDGDQVALEVSTPAQWQADAPTVVLIHGLCGCHRSPYMMRLARKLWRRGIRAVRMNLRGCGSGVGLARQPYHSGRSGDVLTVLEALHHATPHSPTTLVGFSLGGNLVRKLAGELRTAATAQLSAERSTYVASSTALSSPRDAVRSPATLAGQLRCAALSQVIAVCPPADLAACVRLIARPTNRRYEQRFLRLLKTAVAIRHARFPDLPRVDLAKAQSLYAFDDLYTAPCCGFRDADDYYARCSAAPLVPRIAVPCRVLLAADDPFIDATVFDRVALPPHVEVVRTAGGGHLGFLGTPGRPGGYRWMDTLLLAWIAAPLHAPHRQATHARH